MLDTWQNQFRILRGTNAASDALIAQWNLHSKQMQLPAYTGSGAFTGTATANLSVDSSGNIITTAIGSALTGGSTNYIARWASSTTLTTGSLYDNGTNTGVGNQSPLYKLDVSGDIRSTGAVYANANGTMYFRGGDDAELWDINVANTVGVYGQQDSTVGSIKLGSGGGTISGKSGNIGIGTITPNSASLHVSGNVFATSFTGSLLGTAATASYVLNAISSSYAATASVAPLYVLTSATSSMSVLSASFASTASFVANAQTASYVLQAVSASFATNSTNAQTASYVLNAVSASFATSASQAVNAQTASYVLNAISASYAATSSYANNFTVAGTLTAQTIVAQYITSSTEYITGSTQFGSLLSNTHQFTGSVSITGSLTTNGNTIVSGSLTVATSSNQGGVQLYSNSSVGGGIRFSHTNGSVIGRIELNAGGGTSGLDLYAYDNFNFKTLNTAINFIPTTATNWYTYSGNKFNFVGYTGFGGEVIMKNNLDGTEVFHAYLADTYKVAFPTGNISIGKPAATSPNAKLDISGSTIITGSLNVTQGITGSLFGTSSWASNAVTASYVLNAVSSSFTSTATSASFASTASYANSGFNIGISQIQTATVASSIAGANNLFTTSTGSFSGAKYLYTATSASNARMGEIFAVWSGGSVQYTDISTLDIGSTTAVTASVSIVTAQAQLNFQTNTSGWNIKSQATFI